MRTTSGDFFDGILRGEVRFCSAEEDDWVSTLTSGPGEALIRGEPMGE